MADALTVDSLAQEIRRDEKRYPTHYEVQR
jgi:hypothetical protein